MRPCKLPASLSAASTSLAANQRSRTSTTMITSTIGEPAQMGVMLKDLAIAGRALQVHVSDTTK